MFTKTNIKYILVILCFFVLLFQNLILVYIPYAKYFDEILALFIIPVFFKKCIDNKWHYKIGKYNKWIIILYLVIIVVGFFSSIYYKYQPIDIVLSDFLLVSKFFYAYFLSEILLDLNFLNQYKLKIGNVVKCFIIFFSFLTILNYIFKIWPLNEYRFGIMSNQLFYSHPTILAAMCIFLLALLLATVDIKNNKKYIILISIIMLSTLRFKAIGAAAIVIALIIFIYKSNKKISIWKLGLLSLFIIAITWKQISYYYIDIDDSARKSLNETSFKIAQDYFPVGTGFGTFASYFSVQKYSPIYKTYGIDNIYGLRPEKANFVSDVFWPMILGQFGIIGLISYVGILLLIFKKIQDSYSIENKQIYMLKMISIVYLLISSTSESAFVHTISIPLAVLIGINTTKKIKKRDIVIENKTDVIEINELSKEKIKNIKEEESSIMAEKKLNGTVIVTYRCNARCTMCNRYKCPSRRDEEISIETIKKLPRMYFTNITGGEPFMREDLADVVRELYKKSDRIVISTNGFFTDRIIKLCEEFPNVGIRISIEGMEETNNKIRGLEDGFNRGISTLKKLKEMGHPDVGFGMTVQDANAKDLVKLYDLSNELNMEFATASLHNSFYFVEAKNIIHNRPMVAYEFERLINKLLDSNSPKKWFRAYFNHGLINYIYGQKRLLPCDMAFDTFFIDPYGDVMPCNGTKDKEVMGNLNECATWDELWNSEQAEKVRKVVRHCDRQCWMIGSVSPAMHKYIWKPAWWVFRHKFLRFFKKKKYSMFELPIVRKYRDGKVTKEDLDKCSTCDFAAKINNGLKARLLTALRRAMMSPCPSSALPINTI